MDEVTEYNAAVRAALLRLIDEASGELRNDLERMLRACAELADLLDQLPAALIDADADRLRELRHDVRSPVGQIVGYCELLAEEAQDDGEGEWVEKLETVKEEAVKLRRAVEALAAELSPRGDTAPRARSGAHEVLGHATVLVIDDNPANRQLLSRVLGRDGINVLLAEDGERGLEVMRGGGADLILLDIVMPRVDGYQVLDAMMRDKELRHLPVIMLTSLDERDSIAKCIEAGAWDHVPKPFDPAILRARIGGALERKAARDREREYLAQIVAEKKRADDLLHGVIPIGVALTSEREEAGLLARILTEARRFCGAEGGVLYLSKDGELVMMWVQVDALGLSGPPNGDAAKLTVAEGSTSPAVQAAMTGEPINIRDIAAAGDLDVSHVRAFDVQHGFRTRSLLSLPLRRDAETLGVLELWNATRATDEAITGFSDDTVEILTSLSMLATAALDAYRREDSLRQQIRRLEIRVDAAKRERQVSAITETDYFKALREKARQLRKAPRG